MRLKLNVEIIVLLALPVVIQCQLNAVKSEVLAICYNESAIPGITIANNRPPATLNVFLEILRRIEDANPAMGINNLAALLIQKLRQNGIEETRRAVNINIALPYAPTGQDALKGTIIFDEYLPTSQIRLSYGDLSMADVCAFHYMISNSINKTIRGDEDQTCIRSARYQMRRTRATSRKDVETIEKQSRQSFGSTGEPSLCPIEKGVVYNDYGPFKAGQVIQGLAAGLNQEVDPNNVDNRYAATLAGDLCQAALIQMSPPFQLGGSGGWNSTTNPKYYFLQQNDNLDLTDQDIRGSLDGLYMALKINDIKGKTDVKISQVLDMYYSPQQKGVFNTSFRACNRNILYSELVDSKTLQKNINNLMSVMDDKGQYPGYIVPEKYPTLAEAAFNNFASYLPRLNVDLQCPQLDSGIERVRTDLLIFIDPNWEYRTIQPILSYILDNIDVNKFASRYSLFSGADASNITNSTSYLLEFHNSYNLSVHQRLPRSFDYSKVYEKLESVAKSKLNNNTYNGGESTIILLITKNAPTGNQETFVKQRKEIIKQYLPDLSLLVLGEGSSTDYSSMLLNPSKDFISLSSTTNDDNLKNIGQNVVDAIKRIPRAIVNPACGSSFVGSASTTSYSDSVDLYGTNYYKISPYYFATGSNGRSLRITEPSTGSITVCISRDNDRPTSLNGDCQTLQSSVKSYDLSNYCGNYARDCSPIYLSIYGNSTQYRCTDATCRFPNNIKYIISLDSVGCTSSAFAIVSNFILIAALFLLLKF
ncbi:uncharacterized protein LOC114343434 [Diabrotica virgifera virgifera]|uniref:Uncharacterized protein LOC114343434 n=1 Tax=Diabrotica virgifera virgifera TaxID=50390 RepID=A0A6P7GK84_DIAVI|nr:uncharacterized protein LOC114343434 [Diabrotica virgifera virgifera]